MSLRLLLRQFLLPILLPVSITSLVYLYLYPIFHGSACAFPLPTYTSDSQNEASASTSPFLHTLLDHLSSSSSSHDAKAPFRLLILADPQLEGDTSLPSSSALLPKLSRYYTDVFSGRGLREEKTYPSLIWSILLTILKEDVPSAFRAGRKRLDLWGNDYYLGHIYRTLRWWAGGTHTVVLGDLVGSQWVGDGEFEERGERFWGRVFRGGRRVGDEVTVYGSGEEVLGEDGSWEGRVINVAGNHDVGYAGDISERRMERFERVFGRANWDLRFTRYPVVLEEEQESTSAVPSLHMVVLNSLILDTPPLDQSIQDETFRFINNLMDNRLPSVEDSNNSFTLLLTHVPLHKRGGICTDAPYIGYFQNDDEDFEEGEEGPRFRAGGLREQNHLSSYISQKGILEGVFGMSGEEGVVGGGKGRNGLILTGHDHTGCDVVHFVDRPSASEDEGEDPDQTEEDTVKQRDSWSWDARPYHPSSPSEPTSDPSIREVTLRSMMGDYGGNAGFLSVWYDPDPSVQEWKYEISTCMFGVQHIWWAVHVLGIVSGLLFLLWVGLEVGEWFKASSKGRGRSRVQVKKRQ